jgi:hypothetical protein
MPFEDLETITKANMPPQASLSYMRQIRKGKEIDRDKVKPKLILTLPTSIVISKCEKFCIQIGSGQDFGKMRVIGMKKGVPGKGVKPSEFKSYLVLRFGYVPKFGDEIFDGMKCPIVRIDDDTYEIALSFNPLAQEEVPTVPLRKRA